MIRPHLPSPAPHRRSPPTFRRTLPRMPALASSDPGHIPVLLDEVIDLLEPRPGQTLLDLTVGRGGHAAAILPLLGPGGRMIAFDMDPANAAFARDRLTPIADAAGVELDVSHANFRDVATLYAQGADLVLADLGFASNQMDDPARGLSFNTSRGGGGGGGGGGRDEEADDPPLDMRLDPTQLTTAADLVNSLDERELADLIYQFGEERLSRRIARKIVEARATDPILTTFRLAQIVRRCYPPPTAGRRRGGKRGGKGGGIDPATRTFMALRIAVNRELEALDALLEALPRLLGPGGRAGVIAFHSLEDRRVKHAFMSMQQGGQGSRLTRKPIVAGEEESAANPRSRSAKLRGFVKTR